MVLAWLLASALLALGVLGGPLASWGQWLPLHTLLLGGVGSAITVWSAHFADTLLHRPALGGALLLDARLAAHGVGSLMVLTGVTTSRDALTLAGASTVAVAALAGVLAITVQYRRAVAPRLVALALHYALALALLALGAAFGYLLSRAESHGSLRTADALYVAHTMTMLMGFVGTTVLGTLTVLWPTMLRTKMEPCAPRWTTRALPGLLAGTALLAASGLWRPLAAAGLVVYLAGAAGVLVPAWRTARRVPPTSFATASTAAGMAWFVGCIIWVGAGLGAAPEVEVAREMIHLVRVPLAAGFALQVLAAALSYLTPVMLGGGPATTRVTNAVMDCHAFYRVTAVNACLALAVLTPLGWQVRGAAALVAGLVASYVPAGMVRCALTARSRRLRSTDAVVATTLTVGPPPTTSSSQTLPVGARSPQSQEPHHA